MSLSRAIPRHSPAIAVLLSNPARAPRLGKLMLIAINPPSAPFVFEPGTRPPVGIDTLFGEISGLTTTLRSHTFCVALLDFVTPFNQAPET